MSNLFLYKKKKNYRWVRDMIARIVDYQWLTGDTWIIIIDVIHYFDSSKWETPDHELADKFQTADNNIFT